MSRKTKEEAEKTRLRILASALSLFVKRGYDHTTFTDIAERLHLTKGAVYYHFESKESLIVELVKEMLEKFRRQLEELMPKDELTFPAVAEMMVENAVRIVEDPKGAAFFMLMKTQIKWGADTMAKTREDLRANVTTSPYHAFVEALKNDIAAGRVRSDVNPDALASICIATWDGLVMTRIEKFLQCDLAETLHTAYDGLWNAIKLEQRA